ncbi:MAG: GNAT family N-acetyltransferase [Acidobacteria bacterium]|nr:GNAT family N-acetyltransferase [Acidobacteriota bacterium]
MSYRVRAATLDDAAALVRHRVGMFTDMGVVFDAAALATAFDAWLNDVMRAGTYRAWVVEAEDGADNAIVAGGGITILPWPPGPQYMGSRLAFVYNVYTEPAHRRRGLARLVMDEIHAWCAGAGITSMALNASRDGQPMYEAMGYAVTPSPMMFFRLSGYNPPAFRTGPAPDATDRTST